MVMSCGFWRCLFEVNHDIGIPSNRKIFQAMMEILIDPERPGDFNQALMDLGSDIEAPVNPRPEDSPVKDFSGGISEWHNGPLSNQGSQEKASSHLSKSTSCEKCSGAIFT